MKKDKSARAAEIKKAVIKQLKGLIFPTIMCLIILAGVYVVMTYQNKEEEVPVIPINGYEGDDKPLVLENDKIKFTMDPTTTHFQVEVKETGKIWLSNPEDGANDPLALPSEKAKLQSTLLITWSTKNGTDTIYDNYNYSIANGIYEIEADDNQIKVKYTIGDTPKVFVIPPVITEERMDSFLAKMEKGDASRVKEYYKKYDINKLGKKDNKEELLENYPIIETEVIYVLRDTTKDNLKGKFEKLFEQAGYTLEDWEADKALDFSTLTMDKPVFNVNMVYKLEGDQLVVEVPMAEMEFRKDRPIFNITPLPYFGAGTMDEDGYLIIPEGGGAIINFNSGKTAQSAYYANMYGWDMAQNRKFIVHNTRAFYNAYSIVKGNDAMMCIADQGASYGSVQADISGRYNSYNYVNMVYSVMLREQYEVNDRSSALVFVYLPEVPKESIVQRYEFISSGDYTDIAKEYREYLMNSEGGQYMTKNDDTEAPVVIEALGAVDKVKQILGVPVSRPLELTNVDEAKAMIDTLKSEGLNNMTVKLTGWLNGGENQQMLSSPKIVSDLGSKKTVTQMISEMKSAGIDVYLDGVTHYANDSDILDGFFVYSDAARYLSKEKAEIFPYSHITYSQREGADSYYLLHPSEIEKMTNNLVSFATNIGANVSFRDTGMDLSADYYRKNMVSREQALQNQVAALAKIKENGQKVMINMGNDYAAPMADLITNMDLRGSEYTLIDKYIPFYQIALHGYVNYTGDPLNLADNYQDELLKTVEYGAGMQFTLMDESAFTLQKTLYTQYFGAEYDAWHDMLVEVYNRYNQEMGHVFNQEIVAHEAVSAEFAVTTYEDGTKVYVNYSYLDATAEDGTKVPARDYVVVR